jgi:hypothetical protein
MKVAEYAGGDTVASANLLPKNIGISDRPEDQLMLLNILSNSLYSDKISAVWREYIANSTDAHADAGTPDKPIEICLPTQIAPNAIIRDFGNGLSREFMDDGFIKLMVSTKRDSNDAVGCLGIGRMAGLAYGDAFVVTNWHKGEKTIYNVFRDKGMPKMALMHREPCGDQHGIEISVPVRREDLQTFADRAEKVCRYLKIPPVVHGGKLDYKRAASSFDGIGWRYVGDGASVAIMGSVGYAINKGAIPNLSNKESTLLDLGVELEFNIGDLKMTPNREGLEYVDLTINALKKQLNKMLSELGQIFSDKIAKATSYWDAKLAYANAFENVSRSGGYYNRSSLREILEAHILWRGKKIESGCFCIENKEKNLDVGITVYEKNWRRIPKRISDEPDWCAVSDATKLVINDLKAVSPSRVKFYFASNPAVTSMVIFTFANNAKDKYWKLRDLTGAPTMLHSSMPKPPPSVSTSTGNVALKPKHAAKAFVLKDKSDASYGVNSGWWETETVDYQNDSGVYVVIDKFVAQLPNVSGHYGAGEPAAVRNVRNAVKAAGLLKGKLYGFKPPVATKLGKGWVKLQDYLQTELNTLLAKPDAKQLLADALTAYAYPDLFAESSKAKFPSGCLAWMFLNEIERMRHPKIGEKLFKLIHDKSAEPWLTRPAGLLAPTIDLLALEKNVKKKYPMLEWHPRSYCQSTGADFTPIAEYVKLIEKKI